MGAITFDHNPHGLPRNSKPKVHGLTGHAPSRLLGFYALSSVFVNSTAIRASKHEQSAYMDHSTVICVFQIPSLKPRLR